MSIALAPQPEPPSTFGQLLRDARHAAGLSQAALAIATGVERPAIGQYEADKNLPAAPRMPYMEDALALDPGTLGAWVRYSPLYLATLPDVPDEGATPGLFSHLTVVPDLAA